MPNHPNLILHDACLAIQHDCFHKCLICIESTRTLDEMRANSLLLAGIGITWTHQRPQSIFNLGQVSLEQSVEDCSLCQYPPCLPKQFPGQPTLCREAFTAFLYHVKAGAWYWYCDASDHTVQRSAKRRDTSSSHQLHFPATLHQVQDCFDCYDTVNDRKLQTVTIQG